MKTGIKKHAAYRQLAVLAILASTLIAPLVSYGHSGHDPLNARDWQAISVLSDEKLPCCTSDELAAVAIALAKGTKEMTHVLREAKSLPASDTTQAQMRAQLRNSLTTTLDNVHTQLTNIAQQPGKNAGSRWLAITRDLSTALPLMASMSGKGFDGKWTQIIIRLLPQLFNRVLMDYVE